MRVCPTHGRLVLAGGWGRRYSCLPILDTQDLLFWEMAHG